MSFFTLCTIVFILYHLTIHAQKWEQLPGPYEESITSMRANSKYIFAKDKINGYYKSSDTGRTWTKMSVHIDFTLEVHNENLFIYSGKELLRSSNNGETWEPLILDTATIHTLVTMKGNIYANTNIGIWESSNNGNRWRKTGVSPSDINFIAGENNLLTFSFHSSDLGKTWERNNLGFSSGYNFGYNDILISKKNLVIRSRYKLGFSNNVFISTDDGIVWNPAGLGSKCISALSVNDSFVFVGIGSFTSSPVLSNGFARTSNYGDSWTFYEKPICNLHSIYLLSAFGNNLFAAGERSLTISMDNGRTWDRIGLPLGNIKDLYFDDNIIVVGNTRPKDGLFAISSDYGKTWNEHDSLLTPYLSHNNHRFACGKGIYVHSKDSNTWIKKDSRSLKYAVSSGKNIIGVIDQEKGFLISSDNGNTWDTTYTELGTVTTLYKSENTVYAGVKSKDFNKRYYIATSKSDGISWKKIFPTIDSRELDSYIKSICVNNEIIFLGLENGSLVWSSDQGTTWEKQESFGYSNAVAAMINKDSTFFIATNKLIYRVEDNGKTWIPIQFNSLPINELAVVNDTLFVATERNGIWKYTIPPYIPSGVQNNSTLNKQLTCKVFPNPATDECVIQLHPFVKNAKAFLYNTHGEKITEFQLSSETTKYNTENLSAGVYTLIVQSGSGQQHHPFIVTR